VRPQGGGRKGKEVNSSSGFKVKRKNGNRGLKSTSRGKKKGLGGKKAGGGGESASYPAARAE